MGVAAGLGTRELHRRDGGMVASVDAVAARARVESIRLLRLQRRAVCSPLSSVGMRLTAVDCEEGGGLGEPLGGGESIERAPKVKARRVPGVRCICGLSACPSVAISGSRRPTDGAPHGDDRWQPVAIDGNRWELMGHVIGLTCSSRCEDTKLGQRGRGARHGASRRRRRCKAARTPP